MKKRYTEEQVISAIRKYEPGAKVDDVCRTLQGLELRIIQPVKKIRGLRGQRGEVTEGA
ncbi:MAG: transposase [Gammaproteobacteria bacterium]|jgi:hypothetical protein|nr:transposase [Gammaproteobacteria bacterium]MBT7529623.1 transposase [Gammaproteobacteria bacterium]